MDDKLKKVLEENYHLIDSQEFDKLYDITPIFCRADLTQVLIDIDIDPMSFMSFIPASMFAKLDSIISVVIPKSIKAIGIHAFLQCFNLESVTFSEGLKVIEGGAFSNCEKLKDVILPSSLEHLGNSSFGMCEGFTHIRVPGNVKIIPDYCFTACINVEDAILGEGVEVIDQGAFSNCSRLSSVVLPVSLKNINTGAFRSCRLKQIVYRGTYSEWRKIDVSTSAFDFSPKDSILVRCRDKTISM